MPEKPKKMRGRPKATKEDLEELALRKKIDKFFENRNLAEQTFSAIADYLGYRGAHAFIEAAKKNGGALAHACARIEDKYELMLLSKSAPGAIFALKQVGWADTQKLETEVKSVNINVSLSTTLEDLTEKLSPSMPILEVQESAS